mmetsp:Transcript_70363/g.165652  ORF Transcript_70363/g.165652 Transcript_70363/m.165652 type:complete len:145 (+) Transcript_70363:522-956(+)
MVQVMDYVNTTTPAGSRQARAGSTAVSMLESLPRLGIAVTQQMFLRCCSAASTLSADFFDLVWKSFQELPPRTVSPWTNMQAAEGFTWSQEQGQGPVSEGQGQGQPGVGEFELAPFGFDSEGLPESVRNSRRHGAVTADAGFYE